MGGGGKYEEEVGSKWEEKEAEEEVVREKGRPAQGRRRATVILDSTSPLL